MNSVQQPLGVPPSLPAFLPPLREDLHLNPAGNHKDGSPAWTIQDPVTNRFYRIGWLEFELLSRWWLQSSQAILDLVAKETLLAPTEEELVALYEFLLSNQLLEIHSSEHTQSLIKRFRAGTVSRVNWLLHHYLFFRVPMIRPAERLQKMLPKLAWIYTPITAWVVGLLCLSGLWLTARQWDVFVSSFVDTLSPSGLAGYLLALAVAKSVHELGHALTATRYGLRVAHMGVAFVVMWPMLYTDTGESWRLADKRHRLHIAAAGIISELALAGIATLLWNFVDEGGLKQGLFFLATTAWVISLALNASPFMRFDGYFILSDALDMPNLHDRAGALAKVSIRNFLLGWQEPDPEVFPPKQRKLLVAFALVTWVYRLIVFAGIAAAVYFLFFKLLGIVLFVVEIAWFIVLPVWRELKIWHERQAEITNYRKKRLKAWAWLILFVAVFPWGYQIHAVGWVHPEASHVFYSPLPARIQGVPTGDKAVDAGQLIFELDQPELDFRAHLAKASSDALEGQLRGLLGLPDGEEKRASLAYALAMQQAELQAQADEANRLILKAPFAGELTDIDPALATGVWVSPRQPLAQLVGHGPWMAEILVQQREVQRIRKGDVVRFYPTSAPASSLTGKVDEVDGARLAYLPQAMLSAQYGGAIPVLPDAGPNGQGLVPRDALYRVRVKLDELPPVQQMVTGHAVIEGRPHSWLIDALKPVLIVLIRELTF